MKFFKKDGSQGGKKHSPGMETRKLKLEVLEERRLLALSSVEIGTLLHSYPELFQSFGQQANFLDIDDMNGVDGSSFDFTAEQLKSAIANTKAKIAEDEESIREQSDEIDGENLEEEEENANGEVEKNLAPYVLVIRTSSENHTIAFLNDSVGPMEVDFSQGIYIVSMGSLPLSLEAGGNHDIFHVKEGANFGLAGITLKNTEESVSPDGAKPVRAIHTELVLEDGVPSEKQSSVILVDCTFTGFTNSAIHSEGGELRIINSVFYENESPLGGAVRLHGGTLEIDRSTFFRNKAINGGAIYASPNRENVALSLNITNSVIAENTVSRVESDFERFRSEDLESWFGENVAEESVLLGQGAGIFMGSSTDLDVVASLQMCNTLYLANAGLGESVLTNPEQENPEDQVFRREYGNALYLEGTVRSFNNTVVGNFGSFHLQTDSESCEYNSVYAKNHYAYDEETELAFEEQGNNFYDHIAGNHGTTSEEGNPEINEVEDLFKETGTIISTRKIAKGIVEDLILADPKFLQFTDYSYIERILEMEQPDPGDPEEGEPEGEESPEEDGEEETDIPEEIEPQIVRDYIWESGLWKSWDLRAGKDSPLINAGNKDQDIPQNTDALGNPRKVGTSVDIGAYESGTSFTLSAPEVKVHLHAGGEGEEGNPHTAKLIWNGVEHASYYEVFRGITERDEEENEIVNWISLGIVPTLSFFDSDSFEGAQYRVQGFCGAIRSEFGNAVEIVVKDEEDEDEGCTEECADLPARFFESEFHVKKKGVRELNLSWDHQEGVDGYHLCVAVEIEGEVYWKTVATLPGSSWKSGDSFQDTNLFPNTQYTYKLYAFWGTEIVELGEITETTEDLPGAKNFRATKNTSNSIHLTWDAVAGAHGYIITCSGDGDDSEPIERVISAEQGRTAIFEQLTPDTTYTFQIKAYFDLPGESEEEPIRQVSELSSMREITTKKAPTVSEVDVLATSRTSLVVSWKIPEKDPGLSPVGITLIFTPVDAQGVAIEDEEPIVQKLYVDEQGNLPDTFEQFDLTRNRRYEVSVVVDYVIDGREENPETSSDAILFTATTPPKLVDTRNFGPAENGVGLSGIVLSWIPNPDATSYEITGIDFEGNAIDSIGEIQWDGEGDLQGTPTVSISSLQPGSVYIFTLTTYERIDDSTVYSTKSRIEITTASLTAPTQFKATPLGTKTIQLSWNKPISPVEAPLLGYQISMTDPQGEITILEELTGPETVELYTVGDLKISTKYKFKIAAAFDLGEGRTYTTPFQQCEATTAKSIAPPTGLSVIQEGLNLLKITWNEHIEAAGYMLYITSGSWSGEYTLNAENMDDPTQWILSGLNPGTTYEVSLVAKDSSGNSSTKTTAVNCTISALSDPEDVRAIKSDISGTSMIDLIWEKPEFPDHLEIVSYTITYNSAGSTIVIEGIDPETIAYTIRGLESNTQYTFIIQAVYQIKDEDFPRALSRGTASTIVKTDEFKGPVDLKITTYTNDSITISWGATEGATVGYCIYATDLEPILLGPSTLSYRLEHLTAGSTYSIYVIALGEEGARSSKSSTLVQKTPALPEIKTLTTTLPSASSATLTWSRNLEADGYYVSYEDGSGNWVYYNARDGENNLVPLDWSETTARITNLDPGKTYTFRVQSVFIDVSDLGTTTKVNVGLTKKVAIPAFKAPTGTKVITEGYDGFKITWNAVAGADSYFIFLDGMLHGEVQAGDPCEYFMEDLDSGAKYTISVAATNKYVVPSEGEESSEETTVKIFESLHASLAATTKALPTTGAVSGTHAGLGSLLLTWKAPDASKIPEDVFLDHYLLTYTNDRGIYETVKIERGSDGILKNYCTVSGLEKYGTNYTFNIQPIYTRNISGETPERDGPKEIRTKVVSSNVKCGTFTAPTDLKRVESGLTSVKISWTPHLDARATDTEDSEDFYGYDIYIVEQVRKISVEAGMSSTIITGLEPGTKYTFYVVARAGSQSSVKSANLSITTSKASEATSVKAQGVGSRHVQLNWTAPNVPFGAQLDHYLVICTINGEDIVQRVGADKTSHLFVHENLVAGNYNFRIQCVYSNAEDFGSDSGGVSSEEPIISAGVLLGKVNVPVVKAASGVKSSEITTTDFRLSWTLNYDADSYVVSVVANGLTIAEVLVDGTESSIVIGNLPAGTKYSVVLKMNGSDGKIYNSTAISITTKTLVVPTSVKAVSNDRESIALSWNAPAVKNIPEYLELIGFQIVYPGGEKAVEIRADENGNIPTTHLATGLSGEGQQVFLVHAVYKRKGENSSGTILSSGVKVQAKLTTAVLAPTGLHATEITTEGFTLNWNFNANLEAIHVIVPGIAEPFVLPETATSFEIDGLTAGKKYAVKVVFKGANAKLDKSATLNITVGTYHAPGGVKATVLGTSQVQISLTPPTIPADLELLGYSVSYAGRTEYFEAYSEDNRLLTSFIVGADPEIGSLQAGATYSFVVSALYCGENSGSDTDSGSGNSSGEEENGNDKFSGAVASSGITVKAKAAASIPAVGGLSCREIQGNSFVLTWNKNYDADEYIVYVSSSIKNEIVGGEEHGGVFIVKAGENLPLELQISGLTPGGRYSVSIAARDASGKQCAASKAITVSIPAVAAPKALKATATGYQSAQLTWTGVAIDPVKAEQGLTFLKYQIDVLREGVVVATREIGDISTTSYTVGDLKPGVNHTFTIRALYTFISDSETEEENPEEGAAEISDVFASAAVSATVKPSALPGPTGLAVHGVDYERITLTWLPLYWAENGYDIYLSGSSSPLNSERIGKDETSFVFSEGITAGTKFTFYVVGYDADGVPSANSKTVSATTPAAADVKPTVSSGRATKNSVSISWVAPKPPTGYVIDSYVIRSESLPEPITVSSDATFADIPGLSSGTTYTFTVQVKYKTAPDLVSETHPEISFLSKGASVKANTVKFAGPGGVKVESYGPGCVQISCTPYADAGTWNYTYHVAWFIGTEKIGEQVFEHPDTGSESATAYGFKTAGNVQRPVFEILGLQDSTKYTFEIYATYTLGEEEIPSAITKSVITMKATTGTKVSVPKNISLPESYSRYTAVVLNWGGEVLPFGADSVSYVLQRSDTSNGEFTDWNYTTDLETGFVVYGLETGSTNYFRIKSIYKDAGGNILGTGFSNVLTSKTTVYAAPSGFNSTSIGPTSVELTCKKSAEGDLYTVQWFEGNSTVPAGSIGFTENGENGTARWNVNGKGALLFTIPALNPKTTYTFQITSTITNENLVSKNVSRKITTKSFTAPTIALSTKALPKEGYDASSCVVLQWSPLLNVYGYDPDQITYILQISDSPKGEYADCTYEAYPGVAGGKIFIATGLEAGTKYYFRIKAVYADIWGDLYEIPLETDHAFSTNTVNKTTKKAA